MEDIIEKCLIFRIAILDWDWEVGVYVPLFKLSSQRLESPKRLESISPNQRALRLCHQKCDCSI